ncbi:uncharacterized protein SAPINGB_P004996 [Magnusiomyces paraingens]|uniref:MI domain-containing protein n=1 Tax=Magnusiomyces paraingens TaxID=2606893 RepID=A0A5E8BZ37_9ASCO|nr:uncharacterized protein SAPINGB_P004996 [Saprochaete ingens]VVT56352.1 unnamed protein product [Saprochaete ingens]
MARPKRGGPSLPSDLLDELSGATGTNDRQNNRRTKKRKIVSRKELRKEERKAKKMKRSGQPESIVSSGGVNGTHQKNDSASKKIQKGGPAKKKPAPKQDSDDDVGDFDDDEEDEFGGFSDDDDLDEDDFDDNDEDGGSVEDTWAALKKLKEKKKVATEPETAEDTWAALKKLKEKKNKKSGPEPETAEDTWAALKKLKEKKNKKAEPEPEPETAEDTWAALKKLKEKKKKVADVEPETAEDTWAALKKLKEKKKKGSDKKTVDIEPETAEDTWAALKKLKEKKTGKTDVTEKQKKSKKITEKPKEAAAPPKRAGRSLADLLNKTTPGSSTSSTSKEPKESKIPSHLPNDVQEAFRRDDEDIAFYSKMLGMKDPLGQMPKMNEDDEDGLEDLLDGLDLDFGDYDSSEEEEEEEEKEEKEKKTKPAKRVKQQEPESDDDDEEKDSDEDEDELTGLPFSSDDELDSDDFDSDGSEDLEGLDESGNEDEDEEDDFENEVSESDEEDDEEDDEEEEEDTKPKRENPYVAPTTEKYIPPSVRKRMEEAQKAAAAGGSSSGTTDASGLSPEEMARLRRQVKGQLNRLTDTNIAGIVKTLSDMYLNHPRQYVTEIVTETVLSAVALQGALSEKFLAVHAALVAALYRSAGLEFGAHFVQTLVEEYDKRVGKQTKEEKEKDDNDESAVFKVSNKEAANLISLLAELYSFNIVWCGIVYDFVREFLQPVDSKGVGLDEGKTEMLLRVLRAAGSQLRSDDPRALRDIVVKLNELKARASERGQQLSPRTLFMIGFIEDLKNNRQKRVGENNTETARETRKQMRDFLNANVKAPKREALRVSLDDIRNVGTRGKWWLVGSAWRSKNMSEIGEQQEQEEEDARKAAVDGENSLVDKKALQDLLDGAAPDWMELARQQRMNTDIRRAVFIAIMSSGDYVDAVDRLQQLKLRSKQEREIVRVLLHCCAMEPVYNPFYALVAARLCSTERAISKTFTFCLYDELGELEGDDSDDEREGMGRLYDDDDDDKENGLRGGGDNDEDEDDESAALSRIRQMKQRKKLQRKKMREEAAVSGPEGQQRLRRIVHYAKLYGTLVAVGAQPLSVLKTANLVAPAPDTAVFLNLFFVTLFLQVAANGGVGMPGAVGNGNGNGYNNNNNNNKRNNGNNGNNKKRNSTAKLGSGLAAAMFERKLDPESERGLVHLVVQTAGKGKGKKQQQQQQQQKEFSDSEDEQGHIRNKEDAGITLLRKIRHYLPKVLESDLLDDELTAVAAVASRNAAKRAARVEQDKSKVQWSINLVVDAIDELLERTDNSHGRMR